MRLFPHIEYSLILYWHSLRSLADLGIRVELSGIPRCSVYCFANYEEQGESKVHTSPNRKTTSSVWSHLWEPISSFLMHESTMVTTRSMNHKRPQNNRERRERSRSRARCGHQENPPSAIQKPLEDSATEEIGSARKAYVR